MSKKNLLWLDEIEVEDEDQVGKKTVLLSGLKKQGINIPDGFVLTPGFFESFLNFKNLKIRLESYLTNLNPADPQDRQLKSHAIKKLFDTAPFPNELKNELFLAHSNLFTNRQATVLKKLLTSLKNSPQAVKIVGQQNHSANVKGEANLANEVRHLWSLFFEPGEIDKKSIQKHLLIQKEIDPQMTMFYYSMDPLLPNKETMLLEIGSDRYEVSRRNPNLIDAQILSGNQIQRSLVNKLTTIFQCVESHHYFPLKVEFTFDGHEIFLTNFWPQTAIINTPKTEAIASENPIIKSSRDSIKGVALTPGRKSGPAKFISGIKDHSSVRFGDILIINESANQNLPLLKKSIAIITGTPGKHSQSARFSKNQGIPCVFLDLRDFKKPKNGQVITVDGKTGEVIV